jgi:sulfur-carrier protein
MRDVALTVEVNLFAAARAAADGDSVLVVPSGSLREVLVAAVAQRPGLEAVLPRCSTLVDGLAVHDDDLPVAPGSRVDVLPPFAGG